MPPPWKNQQNNPNLAGKLDQDPTQLAAPGPVALAAGIGSMHDGSRIARVVLSHSAGATVLFMDADSCRSVGQQFEQIAAQLGSGLVIADATQLPGA